MSAFGPKRTFPNSHLLCPDNPLAARGWYSCYWVSMIGKWRAILRGLLIGAILIAPGLAHSQEIADLSEYKNALSGGQVIKMHPDLNMRFGSSKRGILITFRKKDENDYSSVLIYRAGSTTRGITIKQFNPDQAARFRVDAVLNIYIEKRACIVFIESEGVGVNAPGPTTDMASHRGLVFCEMQNQSKLDSNLTRKLELESGESGIQTAAQVRQILKGDTSN